MPSICKYIYENGIRCNVSSSYGYKYLNYKKYERCSKHKLKDMIDVKNIRCKCNKVASFAYKGAIATNCKDCKSPEMINVKCRRCSCHKRARFGFLKDKKITSCGTCKKTGMINFTKK